MIPLTKSRTDRTICEGKISAKYAWRKVCSDHPEHFVRGKSKSHEDRIAEWLTEQNINDCTDNHENYLINIIFVY